MRFGALITAQGHYIKEMVDTGCQRQDNLMVGVQAILHLTRTGLQWRNREGNYPPGPAGYYSFRRLSKDYEKTTASALCFLQLVL